MRVRALLARIIFAYKLGRGAAVNGYAYRSRVTLGHFCNLFIGSSVHRFGRVRFTFETQRPVTVFFRNFSLETDTRNPSDEKSSFRRLFE